MLGPDGNCVCGVSGTASGPHVWTVESFTVEAESLELASVEAQAKASSSGVRLFFWPLQNIEHGP